MGKETVYAYGEDLIYLAACALHGKTPDEQKVKEMNLPEIARFSKWHSMQVITYFSLSSLGEMAEQISPDAFASLKRWYARELRRLVLFDIERERLSDFLTQQGIWFTVLKGAVLQYCYPRLGMRQMCDNDILVDESGAAAIRAYMEENGYTVNGFGKGCHDGYTKDALNFEIHRKLVSGMKENAVYADYFDKTYDRSHPSDTAERHLSDEDFYIYYIYHAYKHFSHGGTGIRTLMDIYVYRAKKGDTLDRAYIDRELSSIGLLEFEHRATELADKLFSEKCIHPSESSVLDESDREELLYYMKSGSFGTVGNLIGNSLERIAAGGAVDSKTKRRYVISRIFPPAELYAEAYPRVGKHKLLIPFLWIHRIFRGIFSGGKTAAELRELKRVNKGKK